MKNLRLFSNESGYESAKGELILPSVSYVEAENKIFYDPWVDPANGHEYVDLGLMTSDGKRLMFATCNIGATKPEEYGLYFAWGGIEPETGMGKNPFPDDDISGTNTLPLEHDIARITLGGQWRIPTIGDLDSLGDFLIGSEWATENGVTGKRFWNYYEPERGSIFIPAAGIIANGDIRASGLRCYLWSSEKDFGDNGISCRFDEENGKVIEYDNSIVYGMSIRPVLYL